MDSDPVAGTMLESFCLPDLRILNLLPVPVFVADWTPGQRRIVFANPRGVDFFGRASLDEVKEMSFKDVSEGARRILDENYETVQVRRETHGPFRRTFHPKTGTRTCDTIIVPVMVHLPEEDTPRTLAMHTPIPVTMDEAAIKAACASFMLERSSMMALLFAREDGSLIHANSLAREKFCSGEAGVTLTGMVDSYRWEEDEMSTALEQITGLEVGNSPLRFEKEVKLASWEETEDESAQEWHTLQFEAMPDPTPSGKGRPAILVGSSDVSELRRAQSALLRMHSEQELFLAEVAHELRTPLNGMTGLSEALLENPACADGEVQKHLRVIHAQSRRLIAMVSDIVDAASNMRKTLLIRHETVDLCELAQAAVDTMSAMARRTVQLSSVVPAELPVVQGDSNRLFQVLVNLIANALRFTAKGHVRVAARRREAEEEVELAVEDTGTGIPTDKLDKIFDPFAQVDRRTTRKYGGTGLGLSLVRTLVDAHHGRVKVASQHGGLRSGTRVTVILPLQQRPRRSSAVGSPLWGLRGGEGGEGQSSGGSSPLPPLRGEVEAERQGASRAASPVARIEEERAGEWSWKALDHVMLPCWVVDAPRAADRRAEGGGSCRVQWANSVAAALWGGEAEALRGAEALDGPLRGGQGLTRALYDRLEEGETEVVRHWCDFVEGREGSMDIIVRRLGPHPSAAAGSNAVLHVGLRCC